MSLTRRILEGARTGLHQLTSLVIVDDEPLSSVEAAALEVELAARKKAAATSPPGTSAIARLAGPGGRADRARQAAERATRINGAKAARAAADKRAADDAFRRMKEQAARGGGAASTASKPGGGTTGGARSGGRPRASGPSDAQLADWYKALNLAPGADLGEIKSAYRQLMRRYHPDMHAGNPAKQKAANELSMRVTAAYNGLQEHLSAKG